MPTGTEQVKTTTENPISVDAAKKIIEGQQFPDFEKLLVNELKTNSDKLLISLNTTLTTEKVETLTLENLNAAIKLLTFLGDSISLAQKSVYDTLLTALNTKKDALTKQTTTTEKVEAVSEADKTDALNLFENGAETDYEDLWKNVFQVPGKEENLTGQGEQTPYEIRLRKLIVAYGQIKSFTVGEIKECTPNIGQPHQGKMGILVYPKNATADSQPFEIFWRKDGVAQATEAIKKTMSLNSGIKESFNQLIKDFGGTLLSVIEFLGGKGALKWLTEKFKIDGFEKLYDDVYKLDPIQSGILDAIYKSSSDADFSSNNVVDKKKIEQYYANPAWLNENFKNLDPILVNRAMKNANLSFPGLITEGAKSYGEMTYKINDAVITDSQKQTLFTKMLEDSALWNSVDGLAGPDVATTVYGKSDTSRTTKWGEKLPKTAKATAVAFGACLMKGGKDLKYVISQSTMPYQLDNQKTTQQSSENTAEAAEKATIEKDWTAFVDKCNGVWGKYPLTVEPTTASEKKAYDEYKTAISTNISKLLDPNTKDLATLASKDTLKPFLEKHLTIYLKGLTLDKAIYKDSYKTVIDNLLSIKAPFVINVSATGISISGKDATSKDIKIESSSFGWLPKKKEQNT